MDDSAQSSNLSKDASHLDTHGEKCNFAAIGAAAAVLVLLLVGSLPALLASESPTQFVIRGAWCSVLVAGLWVVYLAWEVGGFSELQRQGLPKAFAALHRHVALTIYRIARIIVWLGTALGGFIVFSVLSNEPPANKRLLAALALGAVLGGLLLMAFARRRDVTVTARIMRLESTMKTLGVEIGNSSRKLAEADNAIRDIDRDLQLKFQDLANRRSVNDELSRALTADPEVIKAIQSAQWRECRRALFQQIALVIVGFLLGYVVNFTSDDADEWLRRFFG